MNAAEEDELPPPASGLVLEISFRRLLASCEAIAFTGDNKGKEDLKQWKTSPVFHHYIETLQEQLSDLENSSRIDPHTIRLYKHKTTSLSSSLKRATISDLCRAINSLPARPPLPQINASSHETATTTHTLHTDTHTDGEVPMSTTDQHPGRPTQNALPPIASIAPSLAIPNRVPQLATLHRPTEQQQHLDAATTRTEQASKPVQLSDAAKKRIEMQQRLQDHLTDELADMASALKTNTKAVESKVRQREGLLDGTETALEKSAAATKAGVARATRAHRRGRTTLCFTCLVLMLLCAGFVSMYVFIRLTTFTGYKAVRPSTKANQKELLPTSSSPSPSPVLLADTGAYSSSTLYEDDEVDPGSMHKSEL